MGKLAKMDKPIKRKEIMSSGVMRHRNAGSQSQQNVTTLNSDDSEAEEDLSNVTFMAFCYELTTKRDFDGVRWLFSFLRLFGNNASSFVGIFIVAFITVVIIVAHRLWFSLILPLVIHGA